MKSNLVIKGSEPISSKRASAHSPGRSSKGQLVGEVTAQPYEQPRLSLGHFTSNSKLPGYALELTPDSSFLDSVTSEVMTIGDTKHYELVLHIANYGERAVTARVWRL